MEPNDVILVNANPLKDQFGTAIRYTLMGASAFAVGLGYQTVGDQLNDYLQYAAPVGAFLAFVWGQLSSRKNAQIKRTLAATVPDSVAQLK